jgi:hypothetical protein
MSCSPSNSVINPTAISKTLMDVEVLSSDKAGPSPIRRVEKVELSGEVMGSAMEGMKAFWNAIQGNETAPGMIMITYILINVYSYISAFTRLNTYDYICTQVCMYIYMRT